MTRYGQVSLRAAARNLTPSLPLYSSFILFLYTLRQKQLLTHHSRRR
jgi:hypothetical protein